MRMVQRPVASTWRQRLSQVRRVARRGVDLWPLTALGALLSLVAALALFRFGHGKLDLVLLVLGYGSFAVTALAVLVVVLVAAVLKYQLLTFEDATSHAVRVETASVFPTDFFLPRFRWVPFLQLACEWEHPGDARTDLRREGSRFREHIAVQTRGEIRHVRRRITVQDAFGLSRVSVRADQAVTIDVVPHLGGIRHLPVLTSLAGGEEQPHPMGLEDGDRLELRRYVAGDPARFIHWKVFGRTRKLMVRHPERALTHARRTVAYLIAGPHDGASAAAARAALERGVFGNDWSFGADGSAGATSDLNTALHKIVRSSAARGNSAAGLKAFLDEVERDGPATLVLFVPPHSGAWLSQVQRLKHRAHAVIGVDALPPEGRQPAWKRWLLREAKTVGPTRTDLDDVAEALRRQQCEVVVLDRVSGRIVSDSRRKIATTMRAA